MKQNKTHKNNDAALLHSLPVSKGKLIIAAVLVTIMGFMWLRLLLFNKSPDAAAGAAVATVDTQDKENTPKPSPELTYIELPFVPGRHDVLRNDIFRPVNWRAFKAVDDTQNSGSGGLDSDKGALTAGDIRRIDSLITLDGIIAEGGGQAREAFINGKLVSVGSKVAVEYDKRSVELTVTEIYRNKVVLRVGEFTLSVMMVQTD